MLQSVFLQAFVKLVFITDNNVRSRRIVRLQDKGIRQAVKIYLIKGFPNAEKRDQVFRTDFLLNPFPNSIFVRKL